MTYVLITFVVLLILNLYCSSVSQELIRQNKQISMLERCQLVADEITKLEVINHSTVQEALKQIDSLKFSRAIITDQAGLVLYDSSDSAVNGYALFPEVVEAVSGHDSFSWTYHSGAAQSFAASPIVNYGTIVGCVYLTEYDTSQGALIQNLQITVLQVTLVLEIAVALFSFLYATRFSRRVIKIMDSMRVIQEGDYSHKLKMSGSDELAVLSREFDDLTDRLQTSEQKRRRFVSDASHELKTPLASIKLLTDSILQNDMDPDTTREFVHDIGNEAERLNRMTAKLLSLTKVDNELHDESEIIYMAPTVRRVAKMLSAIARNEHIQLVLELEDDCPILIFEDDLYQIVFNLIENGIKYNLPGGTLTVTLHHKDDNALISIRDTGLGIPADALPHIFERFYRVDKARSRSTGGSGLGLSIVKAIVRRNRGEIDVTSVAGQGTTFTVTFPAFETEVDKE